MQFGGIGEVVPRYGNGNARADEDSIPPLPRHRDRDQERGSVMLISLVILTSLGAIGLLSFMSTRASLQRNTLDSQNVCALYAARGCVASAQHALSEAVDAAGTFNANVWTPFLTNEATWQDPSLNLEGLIHGGDVPDYFGAGRQCRVSFQNNVTDGGFETDNLDSELVVRSVGSCNGAVVVLKVTLASALPLAGGGRGCGSNASAQANGDESNAGRADCLAEDIATTESTFSIAN